MVYLLTSAVHGIYGLNYVGGRHLDSGALKATSHTRLRARDHHTLTTLIGGKGGAGPSSLLHPTLEGPEYVNARWM